MPVEKVLYGDRCVWNGLKSILVDVSSRPVFEEAILAVRFWGGEIWF